MAISQMTKGLFPSKWIHFLLSLLACSVLAQDPEEEFMDDLLAPGEGDPAFEELLEAAFDAPSIPEEEFNDPFFDALLEDFKQPVWQSDAAVSVGVGGTDNVLRAEEARDSEVYGYLRSLTTVSRNRPGAAEPDFVGVALIEAKQFAEAKFVDNEVFSLLQGEMAGKLGSGAIYRLPISHVFIDQVYDRTLREVEPVAGRIRLNLLQVKPAVELELDNRWVAKISGFYAHSFYALEHEDYLERGGSVEIFGPVFEQTSVGVLFSGKQRDFFYRVARDAEGRPLQGDLGLQFRYWDIEAYVKKYWTKEKSLYSDLWLVGRIRRDNASGYYDYHRIGARLQTGLITERLEFFVSAAFYRDQFTVQKTRIGGPLVLRKDFELETEVAWKLSADMTLFLAGQLLYSESSDVGRLGNRIVDVTSVLRARDVLMGVRMHF